MCEGSILSRHILGAGMSINVNLFQSRTTLSQSVKKKTKATSDLYKHAMNLVMEGKTFDLSCPEKTASLIVAKHFLRKGKVEEAEILIQKTYNA